MKCKLLKKAGILLIMTSVAGMLMTGCQAEKAVGTDVTDSSIKTSAASSSEGAATDPEATVSSDAGQGSSSEITYNGSEGWSVQYNPDEFELEKSDDSVSFVYKKGESGENKTEILYVPDKQPEELLAEITEAWGIDPIEIERTEGIFPGTTDKWGFWRDYKDDKICRSAVAGEYNGGVLLFNTTVNPSEETMPAIRDALSNIRDSVTYDDFKPQEMFYYVPGRYVMTYTDEIEGEEISVDYYIELNADHTGLMSMQDDIEIMWGSFELTRPDVQGEAYEYTIEGDDLMLNLDGRWITFSKTAG